MNVALTQTEFDLIRNYIKIECGIDIPDGKEYLIESRLANIMAISGSTSYSDLYYKAARDKTNKFRDKIIDAITTNETSWFRDKSPFTVLKEVILPERLELLRTGKTQKLRIWSAACSTGQEPYSIAMILLQLLKLPRFQSLRSSQIDILATDISKSALLMAKLGRYDNISMSRGMPQELLDNYFTLNQRVWTIDDKIKNMVEFKLFNLQNSFQPFGIFDIVLCRNVAIYFSDEFKTDVFNRIAEIIKNDGYLFLGTAESLSNYTDRYKIQNHNNAIYYQVK